MNMDEESGDCGSLAAGTATTTAEHQQQQQQQPKIEQPQQNESPQLQQEQSSSSSTSSSSVSSAAAAAALSAASSSSTSSSSTTAAAATTATTASSSSSSTTTTQAAPSTLEPSHNDLFSTKRWGTTPIRQDTPWELPPSPTQTNQPQQQQPQASSSSSSSLASSSAAAAAAAAAAAHAAAAAAAAASLSSSTILPPGISQSGDSANGLATSLGQMSLGLHSASRFDQPWRAPTAINKPQQHQANSVNSFANHTNQLNNNSNSSGNGTLVGGGVGLNSFVGSIQQQQQPGSGFARAPGPASSIMDNNSMTPKPFGMANRSSTWSAFGAPPTPNSDSEREWPKSTISGISAAPGNHHHQQTPQPSNAFDLVPDFGDPGKSWHGSMLMKGLGDDDPTSMGSSQAAAAAAVSAFANANPYAATGSSKSPSESQYEPSGIGTWSPIVKGGRPGSKWDGDGPGDGDNGRFDDGTAIWGSPAQTKVVGVDWVEKTGDPNSNNQDKSRPLAAAAGNNQSSSSASSYRPLQQSSSSSSTSLLMSSNTSPPSQQQHQQHNRGNQQQQQQQNLKQQHSLSHNFDQVQQQSNALSSQANQPSRGSVLSSNVPSTQQLKHMVQQIQLAVQAGHLNPQILNQPLAPITLQLLYQLLQQIKILHQLQISVTQQFNKPGSHPAAINVHITKTKQNILNLQNQIAAQQAVFLKQHQHQPQQQQQQQQHNISSSRQPTMPTTLTSGGVGGGIGPTLPPGISQSGDSFRSGTSLNDFHGSSTMINNFGIDSMGGASANGLGGGGGHMGLLHTSRFDQPWRAPAAIKPQHHQTSGASQFATNHNLNSSGNGGGVGSVNFVSSMQQQQQGNEFARAPGPATSLMDNNSMTPKPFGMANRSSTWSAFGAPAPNEPEAEWPKTTTTSGISAPGNSTQPSNAFDLVPEFEPGKPWRGSMLMKSVEDDPTMTPGSMARSLAPQRKTIWSDEIL